jgi:hypothetical protein
VTIGVTANPHSPIARWRKNLDRAGDGPGGCRRLDANESGHGAKAGAEPAKHSGNDSLGPRLQQLDGGRRADATKSLRRRGLRILQEACGATPAPAARALAQADNRLRVALVMLKMKSDAHEARAKTALAHNNLRGALGE